MRNRSVFLSLAGLLLAGGLGFGSLGFGSAAEAKPWAVDAKQSSISFSGQHVGKTFKGSFGAWQANIDFDPANPEAARVEVTIDLASAKTGDAMYDKTLPSADWFNTAKVRQAKFVASKISKTGDNTYVADGQLAIRGKAVPVKLPFTLNINGDTATMDGKVTLKRTAWGIGSGSDAKGEWVSLNIPVQVRVVATAK